MVSRHDSHECSSTLILPGLRVVRGEDWDWGNQDNGPGGLGTVIGANFKEDANTAWVQWDTGTFSNYRCGSKVPDGVPKYDLRVYDNATCGVYHRGKNCRYCKKQIVGFIFRCNICPEEILCLSCYMDDEHDLSHSFGLLCFPESCSVVVLPARCNTEKGSVRGLFVGALVTPLEESGLGSDCNSSELGLITDITDEVAPNNTTFRSFAKVEWLENKESELFPIGTGGKVGLCVKKPYSRGCYIQHLPRLGAWEYGLNISPFNPGDLVAIAVGAQELVELQRDHCGWNARMTECIGKEGLVTRLTDRGDVRVEFKVFKLAPIRWTLNPAALKLIKSRSIPRLNSSLCSEEFVPKDSSDNLCDLINARRTTLFKAATKNDLPFLKSYLERFPKEINSATVDQRTALHFAVHEGHFETVQFLLSCNGVLPDAVDSDGDTLYHHAVYGSKHNLIPLLNSAGANPNIANNKGFAPLHIAVLKLRIDCMVCLLTCRGIDINMKDIHGRTPLHIAVDFPASELTAHHSTILEILVTVSGLDPFARDKKGASALDIAVRERNFRAMRSIAEWYPRTVDERAGNGSTPLMQALVNSDAETAELLINQLNADVNLSTHQGCSPLYQATLLGSAPTVAALIAKGADVSAVDEAGNNPLHVAVRECIALTNSGVYDDSELLQMKNAITSKSLPMEALTRITGEQRLSILCFLLLNDADYALPNCANESPSDLVGQSEGLASLDALLEHCYALGQSLHLPADPAEVGAAYCTSPRFSGSRPSGTYSNWKCELCDVNTACVRLRPCGHALRCKACLEPNAGLANECATCCQRIRGLEYLPQYLVPAGERHSFTGTAKEVILNDFKKSPVHTNLGVINESFDGNNSSFELQASGDVTARSHQIPNSDSPPPAGMDRNNRLHGDSLFRDAQTASNRRGITSNDGPARPPSLLNNARLFDNDNERIGAAPVARSTPNSFAPARSRGGFFVNSANLIRNLSLSSPESCASSDTSVTRIREQSTSGSQASAAPSRDREDRVPYSRWSESSGGSSSDPTLTSAASSSPPRQGGTAGDQDRNRFARAPGSWRGNRAVRNRTPQQTQRARNRRNSNSSNLNQHQSRDAAGRYYLDRAGEISRLNENQNLVDSSRQRFTQQNIYEQTGRNVSREHGSQRLPNDSRGRGRGLDTRRFANNSAAPHGSSRGQNAEISPSNASSGSFCVTSPHAIANDYNERDQFLEVEPDPVSPVRSNLGDLSGNREPAGIGATRPPRTDRVLSGMSTGKDELQIKIEDKGSLDRKVEACETEAADESGQDVASLMKLVEQLKDEQLCQICLDSPKNSAFHCGHQFCYGCATKSKRLKRCPYCQRSVNEIIRLYT